MVLPNGLGQLSRQEFVDERFRRAAHVREADVERRHRTTT